MHQKTPYSKRISCVHNINININININSKTDHTVRKED